MNLPTHTRRGLFQMIGAAIAARRVNRALKHYVAMDLASGPDQTVLAQYYMAPAVAHIERMMAFHGGRQGGKSLAAARVVIEHLKAGRSVVLADSTGRYTLTGKRHDEAA